MSTIDDVEPQARFVTECQKAIRAAKASKRSVDLQKAAGLLESHRMDDLPEWVRDDLRDAYAGAVRLVTGGLAP